MIIIKSDDEIDLMRESEELRPSYLKNLRNS